MLSDLLFIVIKKKRRIHAHGSLSIVFHILMSWIDPFCDF